MNDIPKGTVHHPPSLDALTESELVSLYNLGSIRNLDADESLMDLDEERGSIFLILEGSVRVTARFKENRREIALLGEDGWITNEAYSEPGAFSLEATASEPSTVMSLEPFKLQSLSSRVQALVFENLNRHMSHIIGELARAVAEEHERNRELSTYVLRLMLSRSVEHDRSDLIVRMIDGVPRLPAYIHSLALSIFDEDTTAREIVELVRQDPSLVGLVLKTVNSPTYNFQKRISDFHHAVVLLGFNQVYQIVVNDAIARTMPDTSQFQELQKHSLLISLMAFEISYQIDRKRSSLNSTIGLLHDIGRSIVLLLGQRYPKIRMLVRQLDEAKIGAMLLEHWNLPEIVFETVTHQHYPEFAPPGQVMASCRDTVAILHLTHLCYEVLQGKEDLLHSPFFDEYMDVIQIKEKSISEFVRKYVLPAMNKRVETYPEYVRAFVKAAAPASPEKEGTVELMLDLDLDDESGFSYSE